MTDISKKVLEKIKKNKIKPIPKWMFVLKWVGIWFLFILTILIGGLAVSTIIFRIMSNEWDLYPALGRGPFYYIFMTLPYFWLVMLGVFAYLAHYYFRKTKKGYKYSIWIIFGIVVFLPITIGSLVYANTDYSYQMEKWMTDQMPFYEHMDFMRRQVWRSPEDGFLAGEIKSVQDEQFLLEDFDGNEWLVGYTNAKFRFPDIITESKKIKMVGDILSAGKFEAEDIRPWLPPRHSFGEMEWEDGRMMRQHMLEMW